MVSIQKIQWASHSTSPHPLSLKGFDGRDDGLTATFIKKIQVRARVKVVRKFGNVSICRKETLRTGPGAWEKLDIEIDLRSSRGQNSRTEILTRLHFGGKDKEDAVRTPLSLASAVIVSPAMLSEGAGWCQACVCVG